ncbi:uncharacterized protein PV09_00679 [Verruconis gallopava]|uniref:Cell wall mannoprotein PIR1-like C-terminal domain-containing protein n=1 Tax=Verruconis gallopava TaxID=253628 RepID=A0A0D2AQE2_9PEZI|nr:uncharacterized protein PV09_00679 [Verruconis gallopava]KIW08740.1 hypothetical protein PV09_00679 [Verruconis gallopava]
MRYALGLLALAASAVALPQGVTEAISPSSSAPAGCSPNYSGSFQITVVNVTSAAKVKRDALVCTLSGGILKDAHGRTGYIASNYQFQFDNPPQAGAIYTAGFSVCSNGSLALGGSAIWYQCYSGGFYNLYDRSWAAQCSPIYIEVMGGSSAPAATQASDGQPGVTTQVSQISDGQVQATTMAVSQISDGQIQNGHVSQISDGQVQAGGVTQISDSQVQAGGVTQISDGQVQAPTGKPVSQISDGQIQANPVGQISDGQIQATSAAPAAAPVTQISDGQVQVHSATPVQQISDGQVQASGAASKASAAPVSQISDGQVQAAASSVPVSSSRTSSTTPAQFTGAAAPLAKLPAAVVAGFAAAVAFL